MNRVAELGSSNHGQKNPLISFSVEGRRERSARRERRNDPL